MKRKYIVIILIIIAVLVIGGIGASFGYKMWREDIEKVIAYPAVDEDMATEQRGDLYGANICDNGDSITYNIYFRYNGGRKYSFTYYYDENGIFTSCKTIITTSSKQAAKWEESYLNEYSNHYYNVKREKNILKADLDISHMTDNKDVYLTKIKELIKKANWYWVEE